MFIDFQILIHHCQIFDLQLSESNLEKTTPMQYEVSIRQPHNVKVLTDVGVKEFAKSTFFLVTFPGVCNPYNFCLCSVGVKFDAMKVFAARIQ